MSKYRYIGLAISVYRDADMWMFVYIVLSICRSRYVDIVLSISRDGDVRYRSINMSRC